MRDQLARLAVDLAVDQDVRADLVVVPHVAGRVLEVPVHLAGVGIPGDRAVGVEVVARPIGRVEHRHRIAGAPDGLVGRRIVGAGHPDGAAAGLPGVVLVLPGLAAGLAGRRDGVLAPEQLAGRGIERRRSSRARRWSPPAAPTMILSLIGERRRRDRARRACRRTLVSQTTLPVSLSVAMMRGGPLAAVITRLPQSAAPRLRCCLLLLGVHAPDDAADVARACRRSCRARPRSR